MSSITDIDDLTNKLTGGNNGNPEMPWFFKNDRIDDSVTLGTPPSAGHYSFWRHAGFPASGLAPGGTARNPTLATLGALPMTDPSGGRQKWLTGLQFCTAFASPMVYGLADRLADFSTLSGTVTTAQNTTSLSVSRYTDGIDNEIWVEIYTLIGATGRTITAAYTDDQNASKTTDAVVIGGTGFREVGRFIRLPLDPASAGVKSVQSVTLSGSTTTAGDFGITIIHPLGYVDGWGAGAATRNYALFEFPCRELKTGAALMLYAHMFGSTPPEFSLMPSTVEA